MIAVDTNVIVRLVTADDPAQTEVAREVFAAEDLWLCKTVLLETEWVLRYSYKLSREAIRETFGRLLGYPQLQVEDRSCVLRALHFFGKGLDFADALHLASCSQAERFATFDRLLVDRARELESGPIVALLRAGAG